MTDADEVLTADEASALLKVSVQTVLKESREGNLPGVKIGREWRYSRTALLAHLRQYPTASHHGADDEGDHHGAADDATDATDPAPPAPARGRAPAASPAAEGGTPTRGRRRRTATPG
jgi:excisionase family DNA binding protein